MKKLVGVDIPGTSYSFSASAKQITINVPYKLTLVNLLLITNVTRNIIIYNFADPSAGSNTFANNVLTLDYDTTSMLDTDQLMIYLDVDSFEETFNFNMRRIIQLLESNAIVDANKRQRVAVETIPSVVLGAGAAAIGTVAFSAGASLGAADTGYQNPAQLYGVASQNVQAVREGPVSQLERIKNESRNAYSNGIRANIIVN